MEAQCIQHSPSTYFLEQTVLKTSDTLINVEKITP